jgi:hypothetical protein
LQNAPFDPIFVPAPWNERPIPLGSGLNFNLKNTQFISVVKIFIVIERE